MSYKCRGFVLPDHLQESIDAYVETGRMTGDFLRTCIENDLAGAIAYADDDNIKIIPAVVGYLYNECPMGCWGRKGIMREWINKVRH